MVEKKVSIMEDKEAIKEVGGIAEHSKTEAKGRVCFKKDEIVNSVEVC